jgi:hypothetical protein
MLLGKPRRWRRSLKNSARHGGTRKLINTTRTQTPTSHALQQQYRTLTCTDVPVALARHTNSAVNATSRVLRMASLCPRIGTARMLPLIGELLLQCMTPTPSNSEYMCNRKPPDAARSEMIISPCFNDTLMPKPCAQAVLRECTGRRTNARDRNLNSFCVLPFAACTYTQLLHNTAHCSSPCPSTTVQLPLQHTPTQSGRVCSNEREDGNTIQLARDTEHAQPNPGFDNRPRVRTQNPTHETVCGVDYNELKRKHRLQTGKKLTALPNDVEQLMAPCRRAAQTGQVQLSDRADGFARAESADKASGSYFEM